MLAVDSAATNSGQQSCVAPRARSSASDSRVSVESDAGALGGCGFEHLAESVEDRLELAIVSTLERVHPMRQFRVARDGMPKPYERSDDGDADGDRLRAAQDGRKHGDAMLGEREWSESNVSAPR